jgi:hypothetical protein
MTRFTIPNSGVRAAFRRTSAGAPKKAPAAMKEHKKNIVKRNFRNQNAMPGTAELDFWSEARSGGISLMWHRHARGLRSGAETARFPLTVLTRRPISRSCAFFIAAT